MTREEALNIVKNPNSSAENIGTVAFHLNNYDTTWRNDLEIALLVSKHPNCSTYARHSLAQTSFALEMAKSPADFLDSIYDLVENNDVRVRRLISLYVDLDTEHLIEMADDVDDEVRMNIASHSRAPSEILTEMSQEDPDPRVRKLSKNELDRREKEIK